MQSSRPGPVILIAATAVALFLLMPLIAVVPVSFTPARFLSMPSGNLSLRHYQALIDNPSWGQSILLSLRIGVLSSAIATALATLFGLGIWMFQPRFSALLIGFVLLPLVVPPVVSAMTLYFLMTTLSAFNNWIGYDTWLGVALAHAVMITPFAVVLILVALYQVDRRIDLAARGLGANLATRAFKVIVPNIKFGIATAALLSFVLSWEEIGVTLFITSVNAITLPRLMWMGLRDNIDPAIAAISVLLILVTAIILGIQNLHRKAWSGKIPMIAEDILARLRSIVGASGLKIGDALSLIHPGEDPHNLDAGVVVLPQNTGQVAAILGLCNEHGIAIVPHGGRTGLAGGAVSSPGEIILSLAAMTGVESSPPPPALQSLGAA